MSAQSAANCSALVFASSVAHTSFNTTVGLFAVVGLLANHQLSAQLLQGTIAGNVTDTSRLAIVEAKITATNQETNFTRDTTSNTTGWYTLPTLPPGLYTISVRAPGFQTHTQTGVVVGINSVTRVDISL